MSYAILPNNVVCSACGCHVLFEESADTPKDLRAGIKHALKRGYFRFMCNTKGCRQKGIPYKFPVAIQKGQRAPR